MPTRRQTLAARRQASHFILNVWSFEMDAQTNKQIPENRIEILPSESKARCRAGAKTCICCGQPRPASAMDDDGCGICEECLKP